MLVTHPIPRVLWRQKLLLGGERNLVLCAATMFGGIGYLAMNLVAIVVCACLWVCALAAFRWMARTDPQMSRVYQRHVKYHGYYPPYSTPYRNR